MADPMVRGEIPWDILRGSMGSAAEDTGIPRGGGRASV